MASEISYCGENGSVTRLKKTVALWILRAYLKYLISFSTACNYVHAFILIDKDYELCRKRFLLGILVRYNNYLG